jgi:hypothetical protein
MTRDELEEELTAHKLRALEWERMLAIGFEVPALQSVVKLLIEDNLRLSEYISCMCYNFERDIERVLRVATR